ncbi:hypothetical protein CHH61_03955 [Shouchella clausii]|uniref:Uncharacterized protein n=1 Tax=Shouchella clausii TaxID=79880 RepID=A0A268S465_SHOCL|nr:hypothetical protein [Shouchella clausii]PAF27290.1 hypothetical protein CHH61_03955 [Shouchella clausii]
MKVKSKTFSNGLVAKHRRSAIIFENADGKSEKESDITYQFTTDEWIEFIDYLKRAANEAWTTITPKEAYSMGSDYNEYYDRRYDNNGYLSIGDSEIDIKAPNLSKDTLYQFNKAKIQSFLFDLEKTLSKKAIQIKTTIT